MVAPVVTPKQNLGLETIGRTFRLLKEHAGTTFGTAGILCIPLAFVGVITALRPGPVSTLLQFAVGGILGLWVAYATVVAVALYSEGQDPGVSGLLRRSLSAGLVRYGFTSLLFNLVAGLVALVTLIPFFLSLASVNFERLLRFQLAEGDIVRIVLGLLLSLPLLFFALLFIYLRLGLSPTASALEGTGPGASLGRSWQVTRGHMWEFFVLTLLSVVITAAISFFVSGPAAMVSFRPAPPAGADLFSPEVLQEQMFGRELGPVEAVITGISAYLTSVLLAPFSAALLANFFLLLRNPPGTVATERSRMVPLQQPEAQAPTISNAPPPSPQEPPERPPEPHTPA
ncbi:MAG TPA: hypothetical protein VEU28_05590 [Actinomycetota bacterium]|nr:hypothetical protein [Actinomycetota bacterium]